MVEDPKWELAILATVRASTRSSCRNLCAGKFPFPPVSKPSRCRAMTVLSRDLEPHASLVASARSGDYSRHVATSFTPDTDPEIAEAMLRYFTRTKISSDVHRDKTDLVAHFSLSTSARARSVGAPRLRPRRFSSAFARSRSPCSKFSPRPMFPSLTEDHVQSLRLFDHLPREAERFRDLNALLESGIIARVRELKQSLDTCRSTIPECWPPLRLTTLPSARSSTRCSIQSAADIKNFAEVVQEQGGSILGNVDGVDVTVEHVAGARREMNCCASITALHLTNSGAYQN